MATEIDYVNDYEFFRAYEAEDIYPVSATGSESRSPRLPMTPWVLVQFRTAVAKDQVAAEKLLRDRVNGIAYSIENDSEWTTVSFRVNNDDINPMSDLNKEIEREASTQKGSMLFDNYFDNLDIEDSGGMLRCSMRLFDREFSRLESILMRTMVAMKASNAMFDSQGSIDKYLLQFNVGSPQSINFRVRFGYSDKIHTESESLIDEQNDYNDKFKNRARKNSGKALPKMVMRSPWYYFQMMACKFMVSEGGLSASIEGISMGTSVFDRLKLLQRFSIMKGTPQKLIENLGKEFYIASGGKIQIVDKNKKVILPSGITSVLGGENDDMTFETVYGITWDLNLTDDQIKTMYPAGTDISKVKQELEPNKYRVEIQYGSEPKLPVDSNGKVIPGPLNQDYMTVKSLLQQICAKVPPMYSIEENNEIKEIKDPKAVKDIFTGKDERVTVNSDGVNGTYLRSAFKPIPYAFYVKEIDAGTVGRIIRIRFGYQKPALVGQEYTRRYEWRNSPNNIMTQFNVISDLDFASMNQTIAIKDELGSSFYSSTVQANTEVDSQQSQAKEIPQNEAKARYERGFMLVHKIEDGDKESAGSSAQAIISNMNRQSFKGSLEVPGDPFYYFSDNMQPYQYGIYVDVKRDRNIYWQGLNGKLESSYLSGFYLISKIRHMINSSGYKTNLEIMKWPTQTIRLKKRT